MRIVAVLISLFLVGATLRAGEFVAAETKGAPEVYMVLLAEGVARVPQKPETFSLPTVAFVAATLATEYGGVATEVWEHALRGFVIAMPEEKARELASDPAVIAVVQDYSLPEPSVPIGDCGELPATHRDDPRTLPPSAPTAAGQAITCPDPDPQVDFNRGGPLCIDNWGIDRIDQRNLPRDQTYLFTDNGRGTSNANPPRGVHVYVLDTGIAASHEEFLDANGVSRVLAGADASMNPIDDGSDGTPPNLTDCASHGHGTHVAGIIAGRTFGVAKDVLIHPIKIACTSSANFASAAVRGLNWVASHAIFPAVINWSGGNSQAVAADPVVNAAVSGVLLQNIHVVQAAGNQSPDSLPSQPALLKDACQWSFGGLTPGVIVVGGSDENDGRWTRRSGDPLYSSYCQNLGDCGSNVGSCIDIWAPAAHVISASKYGNRRVCRLSGTSMAAPHVTGVVALYLEDIPWASINEVDRALRSRGTWNALRSNPNDPNWVGLASDNVLLYSRFDTVAPDVPPKAVFNASCVGRVCSLTSGSTDDFGIVSYRWEWGDGTPAGTGVAPTHTYAAPLTAKVNLIVTDTAGMTDAYLQTLLIP